MAAHWDDAGAVDPESLRWRADDRWWGVLHRLGITLLLTREYEHFVLALGADDRGPLVSYLRLPHPSGLVVDRGSTCAAGSRGRPEATVYVACTRNPNQVVTLRSASSQLARLDWGGRDDSGFEGRPLLPVTSTFLPGCLHLHDLALVGGGLFANAVGENAVIELFPEPDLTDCGTYRRAWWPRVIETADGPRFDRNYLQLNSIAAGESLHDSYFSASTDRIGTRRPGHRNFVVDGRGVLFYGKSREPVCRGLTRPHSARLYKGRVWIDNSGYGEVGIAHVTAADGGNAHSASGGGIFEPVARLPGWTRGLCFVDASVAGYQPGSLAESGTVMFVGTSRVIPRFRNYAPGVTQDICGVHALDVATGETLGRITWSAGNQIFAIDWLPSSAARGLPFQASAATGRSRAARTLFYTFGTQLRPQPGAVAVDRVQAETRNRRPRDHDDSN